MIKQDVPDIDINEAVPEMEVVEPLVDTVMLKAKKEWKVAIFVFAIFVALTAMVSWGYLQNSKQISEVSKTVDQKTSEVSKSADQQISEPVVAVKPVFAVLNGSGVAGAAGKLKTKIEAAGYTVIEVSNASQTQDGTTIEINSLVLDQKDEILKVIGEGEYSPLRDISLAYNVRVVIGK